MDTADTTMVPSCTCLLCHGVTWGLVAAMQRDDRCKRGPQDEARRMGICPWGGWVMIDGCVRCPVAYTLSRRVCPSLCHLHC
jgi:hypothetical protein